MTTQAPTHSYPWKELWVVPVDLEDAASARGASMGRADELPMEDPEHDHVEFELTLTRLRWVDGDYDSGGAYWGSGAPFGKSEHWTYIYLAEGEYKDERIRIFVRARDRKEAKREVCCVLHKAKFVPNPKRKLSEYKGADEFSAAYINTMLWATSDSRYRDAQDKDEEPPEGVGENLDEYFDGKPGEFGPGVWNEIIKECQKFQEENWADIEDDLGQAGHDFFLTRNGHGAGFWDGDWPEEAGKRLTVAAKKFGESEPYVGDDDRLYI